MSESKSAETTDRIGSEGFVLRPGPLRPYATLSSGTTTLAVRLARIGVGVIELAAESVGLDKLDGASVALEVAELFDPIPGTLVVVDDAAAVVVLSAPRRSTTRQLFELAAGGDAPPQSIAPAEHIRDPLRTLSITRALIVNETQGRIRAQGRDFIVRPRRIEGTHLVWDIVEHGGVPTSPLVVECSGYGASYALSVLLVGSWSSPLITTLPRAIHRTRVRRMPRTLAPDELVVRFAHPTFGGTIERRLGDLSDDGLGFIGVGHEDLLCPGLELPFVEVVRGGVPIATLQATVRSITKGGDRVGIALRSANEEVARQWGRLVRELLHERTRSTGYTADALWDLYDAAGYLNLSGRSSADFSELRMAFGDATARLLRAPDVGYHVVWPSERGLDASVANVLVYSRAHLGFQMAKRPGKSFGAAFGKEILRDIHWHTLEEALASSQSDWWIGYVQPTTRFSNLLCCEFQARFRDPERECTVVVHVAKVDVAKASERSSEEGLSIGPATPEELDATCAAIQRTRPRPYWESQDFSKERFGLTALKAKWNRVGLERERVLLVARGPDGTAEAALIADLAHPGLHLYGLMDIARFVPLVPSGERHTSRLIDAAKGVYASFGRKSFVYFHEGETELPKRSDLASMGTASLCVISMELIPDLLDHLFEHMSWDPSLSMPPPAP
jgi:hypothetical protein